MAYQQSGYNPQAGYPQQGGYPPPPQPNYGQPQPNYGQQPPPSNVGWTGGAAGKYLYL